jgi:hypothetical protein
MKQPRHHSIKKIEHCRRHYEIERQSEIAKYNCLKTKKYGKTTTYNIQGGDKIGDVFFNVHGLKIKFKSLQAKPASEI